MQIGAFQIDGFDVAPWDALLKAPLQRAWLERALGEILTPAVLAHLPPPLQLDQDAGASDAEAGAIGAWITALAREADVMTLRARGGPDERQSGAEGALGGLLILAAPPQESAGPRCLHLGYLLGEAYWGKGTASALLRGFTEVLERSGTPVRLLGGVARDNPASARVLEKSGFVADPAVSGPGSNMYRRDIG